MIKEKKQNNFLAVGILCGCLIGFTMGFSAHDSAHTCPVMKKHAIGYSVISESTVLTCCNEVQTYDWHINPIN